jgi:hypothetical protein
MTSMRTEVTWASQQWLEALKLKLEFNNDENLRKCIQRREQLEHNGGAEAAWKRLNTKHAEKNPVKFSEVCKVMCMSQAVDNHVLVKPHALGKQV